MGRSRRSRATDRGQHDQPELVWRRIDLHIHTPASADYQEPDCSFLDILRKAESRGADLIAFTDHNSVRGYANFWREIEDLELLEVLERLAPGEQRRLDEYRRLLRSIRVLPGFELTATFGFHILAIFPEGTSIRQLEHLLLELNVPEDKIDYGSGEVGATSDVLRAYEVLHDSGALVIPAHVNSTHGVAMTNLPFGGQTKIAFTQSEYIHALEATDMESASRRSTARFFNGSKPEYPKRMHIIQGSDAHRLNRDPSRPSNLGACDRMTEVQLEDVSFTALRELFESDHFNRIRPYRPSHDPYDFVRIARAEGETIVQAFHETLPPRRGRLSPVVRDAAAFANGNGGTIFVGISANPRDPVTGVEDAPEMARSIAEDLARYVTPPIAGTIDITATENRQIIVIQVPAGGDKPYAVLPSTIYVRQEGETTLALRDEIVELVKAGVAETTGTLPELVPTAQPAAP
ncbi:MAG: RNA-binding domain-containing protein, partial [Thermomicrobiales bacterium]